MADWKPGIQNITDHGGPDPIQGFDVEVWIQDPTYQNITNPAKPAAGNTPASNATAEMGSPPSTNPPADQVDTGGLILLGSFTSIVITVRNATEAYMELNQRMPRYLDGEVQIAWVMERGMLDIYALKQTFGFGTMRRDKRFNRSPRFEITFAINTANELKSSVDALNNSALYARVERTPQGRYKLSRCKVDSWHMASTAGKQVVANQWQGVSEGITTIDTVFDFDNAAVGSTSMPKTQQDIVKIQNTPIS